MERHYLGDGCPGRHIDEEIVFQALVKQRMKPGKIRLLIQRLTGIIIMEEPDAIKELYATGQAWNTQAYN